MPQAVTEDDDEIFAVHLFLGREDAAEQRLRVHNREETIADLSAGNPLGLTIAGKNRTEIGIGRDLFENVIAGAVIRDIGRRHLSARAATGFIFAPDEDDRFRITVRQRFEQDRIDDAEHRRVRTDTERERNNGDRGEAGALEKHPGAEANILKQRVHITVLVGR